MNIKERKFGCLKTMVKDSRDYDLYHPKVAMKKGVMVGLPSSVSLRSDQSPVEDQLGCQACASNALVGNYEYGHIVTHGSYKNLSRLFVYYNARVLGHGQTPCHTVVDNGSMISMNFKGVHQYGIYLEDYMYPNSWPYILSRLNDCPPFNVYRAAAPYINDVYFRIDQDGLTPAQVLADAKTALYNGYCFVMGIYIYSNYQLSYTPGNYEAFAMACEEDSPIGAHAMLVVGYDDSVMIQHSSCPGTTTTYGAFLLKNSWGTGWGDGGYGYVPYEYLGNINPACSQNVGWMHEVSAFDLFGYTSVDVVPS